MLSSVGAPGYRYLTLADLGTMGQQIRSFCLGTYWNLLIAHLAFSHQVVCAGPQDQTSGAHIIKERGWMSLL